MPSMKAANGSVLYVTPGVFVDGGGWEIVVVNGKLVIKPVPPWDDYPILWSSILITASLQRLAATTEKSELKTQITSAADAIATAYKADIKGLAEKAKRINKDLEVIYITFYGCGDASNTYITMSGQIGHSPGFTPLEPYSMVSLVGGLHQLAKVTDKKGLAPKLHAAAEAILVGYEHELTRLTEHARVEELAHV